ncbi:hypothetical protein LOTGIDRAFT_154949 [Lottia gigantea]|uniref:Uncharacterized protein n=1 Tax=Lottia gigantea TaxID=225164 RepID=V3ZWY6_LOTGI|nr:hypothetical protein LOTGIDRAFT_154949 [Lottia gigantea]ESO85456.1 hypothetical protein LOTGIDRAFT_154949 [Lottia gigantea]
MPDLCLNCNTLVRPRQHAITCDECGKWCHRKCNTVNENDGSNEANVANEDDSDHSLALSNFDITRDINAEEQLENELLPDDDLSETVVEDTEDVTYEVVPEQKELNVGNLQVFVLFIYLRRFEDRIRNVVKL